MTGQSTDDSMVVSPPWMSGRAVWSTTLVVASLFAGVTMAADRMPAGLHPRKLLRVSLRVGALDRSFEYYAPAARVSGSPLVILLHGSGGDGQSVRYCSGYELEDLADRYHFIVAYPDGFRGNWNDCRKKAAYPARAQNVDDEGFLSALVARLVAEQGVDKSRVFVAGYSNGAQLAYRLALEVPERFVAIAAFGAGLPTDDNTVCRPVDRPIPALIVNGTADPLNPFDGGPVPGRGTVLSTKDTAAYFARLDGQGRPTTRRLPHHDPGDSTFVEQTDWDTAGHAEVLLDAVHGGGHLIPQTRTSMPAHLGPMTHDLDGLNEMWSFFARQPARVRE